MNIIRNYKYRGKIMKVAVIMGSKSDYPKLEEGINFLRKYNIEVIVRILSAHRTPRELEQFIADIENEVDVIIAAAGKSDIYQE